MTPIELRTKFCEDSIWKFVGTTMEVGYRQNKYTRLNHGDLLRIDYVSQADGILELHGIRLQDSAFICFYLDHPEFFSPIGPSDNLHAISLLSSALQGEEDSWEVFLDALEEIDPVFRRWFGPKTLDRRTVAAILAILFPELVKIYSGTCVEFPNSAFEFNQLSRLSGPIQFHYGKGLEMYTAYRSQVWKGRDLFSVEGPNIAFLKDGPSIVFHSRRTASGSSVRDPSTQELEKFHEIEAKFDRDARIYKMIFSENP